MKRKITFLISIIFIILFTIPVIATAADVGFEDKMSGSPVKQKVGNDIYYYFETHWKVSKNSKGNPIWDIDKCVPWKTNSMTGAYVKGAYCSAINSTTGKFIGEQRDYKVCLYMDKLKGKGYTDYVYCMLHSTTPSSTKKNKYKTLYGDRTEVSTHIVIDGEKTTLRMGTGNNKLGSKSQKNTSEVENAYYVAYVLTHKGEKIKINKNTEYKYPDNNGSGKAKRGIYYIDKEHWVIKAKGNESSTTKSPYVRLDQWALWNVSDEFLKNINKNIDKTYTSIKKYYDDKKNLSRYAQSQITDLENEATQYQNFAKKYEKKENKAKGKIDLIDTQGDYKRIKVSLSFLKASSDTTGGTRQNVKFGDISGGYVLINGKQKNLFPEKTSDELFVASDKNGTKKITKPDDLKKDPKEKNTECYIFIKNSVLKNNEYKIHFKYKHVVCKLNVFVVSTHFSNQEQGNVASMSREAVEEDFGLDQNGFTITINKTDGDTGEPLEGTFVVYCHHRKASEANKCFGWLKSDGTFTCNKDVKDKNIRYYSYNKKEWKETSGWTYGVSQAAKFTTKNGTVTISGLPKGKNKCELGADDSIEYKVFEITAPEGYNLEYQGTKYAEKGIDATKEIYHEDVSDAIGTPLFISESWTGNQGYVVSNNQDEYTIDIENYKEQKEERMLTINKIDGMKGENVGGATVTVFNTITGKYYKPGKQKEKEEGESTSEEKNIFYAEESNSKVEFEIPEEGLNLYGNTDKNNKDNGLPPGVYQVVETVAPEGFLSPQEQVEKSVDEEIKPVIRVENILIDYVCDDNGKNLEEDRGSNSTQSVELVNIKPGQKGNLIIYKVDAITDEKLDGAKVIIVDSKGNYWTQGEKTAKGYTAVKTGETKTPFTVPKDGIMITDLPIGNYSVIEVEAPPDYPDLEIQKNNDAVVWQDTVYVSSNEDSDEQEEDTFAIVTLKNISETGYITIVKQDADTGDKVSGAYVSIHDENGNYYNELGLKCPSDESLIPVGIDGTSICVTIDHTYTITEVTAPAGYYSVSKQAELGMVTSVSGVKVNDTVILENKKIEPGKARIIKEDVINSSIQLRGTRVTIRDQEGSYYDSYGREYSYAVSIEVPEDGLLIDKLPKQKEKPVIKTLEIVEIKDETEDENTTGEAATKIKEYKEKGKENDKKAKIYTVADGTIYTKDEKTYINIIVGTYFIDLTYTVTEVQSPDGYPSMSVQNSYVGRRDGTVTSGYIDPNAKNMTDVILKNARYANLEIIKIDEETNEPIEGIGFTVEDVSRGGYIASDGSHTASKTILYTNSQGKINIDNILMYNATGKFRVTEVDSKNVFYSTDDSTNGKSKEITIGTGSSYTNKVTFTNIKDYAFKLDKIDLDKTSITNLEAEVLLQYEDGTWLTVDDEGKVDYVKEKPTSGIKVPGEIKRVKRGTYHIYEIKAPKGYCLEYQDGYVAEKDWVDIGEIRINYYRTISEQSDPNNNIYSISPGKESPTITIGNHKYVTVKGFVWEEIAKKGKDDYNNYFDNKGDEKLGGINVKIINEDKPLSETKVTDGNGSYEIAYDTNGVRLVYWNLENACVSFEYGKGEYVTVTVDERYPVEEDIYSRAIEQNYNEHPDGFDDELKEQKGSAVTKQGTLWNYYKEEDYVIETINLGLIRKIDPDYTIKQTLEYVKLTKGDYAFKYNIGDSAKPDIDNSEGATQEDLLPKVQGQTTTYPTFTQPIYPSDIRYNSSGNIEDKDKYKVYVIYKISVHNSQPAEVRDFAGKYVYNEQALELKSLVNNYNQQTDDGLGIDKYVLDKSVNSIDGNVSSQFGFWDETNKNQAKFDVGREDGVFYKGIAPGETKSTYIQFRVTDEALNTLVLKDLTRDETKKFFKCASDIKTEAWHRYFRNDSYWEAGGSEYTKGNIHYSVTKEKTARALFIKLKLHDTRTISGTVFEDRRTEDSKDKNTRVGDGKFNEGIEKKLSDVIVSLVAPKNSVDSEGKAVTIYNVVNTYNDDIVQVDDKKWSAKTSLAITKVKEDGTYSIPGVVPGTYYLQFDYGDGNIEYKDLDGKNIEEKDNDGKIIFSSSENVLAESEKPKIETKIQDSNVPIKTKDYKSTILTGPAKDAGEYWFIENIDGKTNNVATDIDDIIKIRTNNDKEMNHTYIADNGKNVLTARTPEIKLNFEYVANKETAINDVTKLNTNLTGMCFGIIERPKTDMTLNKAISNVKLTLQNGTTMINGNPALVSVSAFLSNITSGDGKNGVKNAKIETDLEKIYGSELEVTYKLTVTNKSEVDYATEEYYKYGTETEDDLVKTKPSKVIDYISEDSKYASFKGEKVTKKLEDLFESDSNEIAAGSGKEIKGNIKATYFDTETAKCGEKLNKLLIVSNTELTPEAKDEEKSKEIYTVVVKKQINNLSENINLESFAEIIGLKNKTGVTQSISTPGNYKPSYSETNTDERDQDRANVSIVPSTGKDKSYTIYIIAGTILIVIAGGIILIKKFVV